MEIRYKNLFFVVGVLFIFTFFMEFMPLGKEIALKKGFEFFPNEIGNWVGVSDKTFSPKRENFLVRKYRNPSGDTIEVFIGFWGKYQRADDNIFSGTMITPGSNYSVEFSSTTIVQERKSSFKVREKGFKNKGSHILVSYLYLLGSEGVVSPKEGRIKYALNAILNKRTDAALIILSSSFFSSSDIEKKKVLHLELLKGIYPNLNGFLPFDI